MPWQLHTIAKLLLLFSAVAAAGGPVAGSGSGARADDAAGSAFRGLRAGEQREVAGVKLCWCPPGTFTMGSPRDEPERRPGETQVEVTLSKGF